MDPPTTKRKRDDDVSCPSKHIRLEEPRIGERPIYRFFLQWKKELQTFEYPVKMLCDTGSSTFCLSSAYAKAFNVPIIKRKKPIPLLGADEKIIENLSEYLNRRLTI